MVLLVEGKMTPVIGLAGCRRGGRSRPAPHVDHLDSRREQDTAAAGPDGRTEVDVLRIHEVTLVQEADSLGIGSAHEQTGATDPIGPLLSPRHLLDPPRYDWIPPFVTANQSTLPQLAEKRQHRAEREFSTTTLIDQPRTNDGRLGVCPEDDHESIDGTGRDHGVAVEQQQILAGARPDADIVAGREAEVGSGLDNPDILPASRRQPAAITRGVIYHDNLV